MAKNGGDYNSGQSSKKGLDFWKTTEEQSQLGETVRKEPLVTAEKKGSGPPKVD